MINLFEYQNKEQLEINSEGIEEFLDHIWKSREKTEYFYNREPAEEFQQFVHFFRRTREIKSKKYVGIIYYEGHAINLLPKIFYDRNIEYSDGNIRNIYNHVLWWLSYCRRIQFPNYQTALDTSAANFLEILIYLFSKYTRELLAGFQFMQYQELNEELHYVKGRIDMNKYVGKNLSTGNWHSIHCSYDSFVSDNTFNRIVKYVSRMLLNVTKRKENAKNLREIIFILDDVSDINVTAEMCRGIYFNPVFSSFEIVKNYCYLFLNNSVSLSYKDEFKIFAFLLPMEYLFEDFIFGFIKKELPDIDLISQSTSAKLDAEGRFTLKPDLLISLPSGSYLADTKYKIVYTDNSDPKRGISQSDLYQMTAYAIRFGISDVLLLYPNAIDSQKPDSSFITIKDEFSGGNIEIHTFQLPVMSRSIFQNIAVEKNTPLSIVFEPLRKNLADRFQVILET